MNRFPDIPRGDIAAPRACRAGPDPAKPAHLSLFLNENYMTVIVCDIFRNGSTRLMCAVIITGGSDFHGTRMPFKKSKTGSQFRTSLAG